MPSEADSDSIRSDSPVSVSTWRQLAASDLEPPVTRAFRGKRQAPLAIYAGGVKRRKLLVLASTIIGAGLGIVGSRFVQPQYVTQSTIWIETADRSGAALGPIRSAELLQSNAWIELLRSSSVLEPVVLEHSMYVSASSDARDVVPVQDLTVGPELRPGVYSIAIDSAGSRFVLLGEEGGVTQSGLVGEPIGVPLGFSWTPGPGSVLPGERIQLSIDHPRDVARNLGTSLQTALAQDGNFLQISFGGTDPVRIASILNSVTSQYVEVAAQLRRSRLDEVSFVLNEQLTYAEENLRLAETELENYRVQTITLPSEQTLPIAAGTQLTRDPAIELFFELSMQREESRRDRESIELVLAQLDQGLLTVDALAAIPRVQAATELMQALEERALRQGELRALEQRYTSEYLPVRRLRELLATLERETIPNMARGVVEQVRVQERDLEGRVASGAEELRRIPPRAIEEARLERRFAVADNLFNTLKQRYEEARLAAESSIPDVRLLDPASIPHRPVQDPRRMLYLLGLVGGLGIGVLGAVLLERFDPRLRYPEQVVDEIGLPIVGAIPHVLKKSRRTEDLERQSHEAFREIRLNLSRNNGGRQPMVITISSPECGDGKSYVSRNLARAYANLGTRTLLIDGDIRRGELHRAFSAKRSPGLVDLFLRTATAGDVLQRTDLPSLFFIGSGTRTQDGPELLSTDLLPKFLKTIQKHFSVVILDSPPLGAGIDPYILAMASDTMLLVLRTDKTNRAFTSAKLDLLDRLPIRVSGVILNGVPDTTAFQYYSYLPGYEVQEESEAAHAAAKG